MGFFKSFIKGTGKVAGKATLGGAYGVGKSVEFLGSNIIKNAMENPLKTAAFIGGAATVGYELADLENGNRAGTAGKAVLGATALSAIPGASTVGAIGAMGLAGAGVAVGSTALSIGSKMIRFPKDASEIKGISDMGKLEFTKTGVGILAAGAAYEGISKGLKKYEEIRMGKNDGMFRSQTPTLPEIEKVPSYANNGGATGDLVFSMYNNRL